MSESERERGYYHVKFQGKWEVAQWWVGNWSRYWHRAGIDDLYSDSDFDAIGPRIGPPAEPKGQAPHRAYPSDLVAWFGVCECGYDCQTEDEWQEHVRSSEPPQEVSNG